MVWMYRDLKRAEGVGLAVVEEVLGRPNDGLFPTAIGECLTSVDLRRIWNRDRSRESFATVAEDNGGGLGPLWASLVRPTSFATRCACMKLRLASPA